MSQGSIFQVLCRPPLDAQSVEEPGGVGRYERRLVGPVVEVVVAEQSDVGHENTQVDVQAVVHIEVISGIRLGEIPIGILQIPLAHRRTRVIARGGGREHAEHRQKARSHIVPVKVPAEAHLFDLKFSGAKLLGGTHDGVIVRMIETLHVVHVEANFGREELGVEDRGFATRRAVHPAHIANVGPGSLSVHFGAGSGAWSASGTVEQRLCGDRCEHERGRPPCSCRNVHRDVAPGPCRRSP